MPEPLSDDALAAALQGLPGWSRDGDALEKTFQFDGFREAVGFIVRLAFAADAQDHHPELTNVYDRVTLRLTTHDAGNTITERDLALARAADALI